MGTRISTGPENALDLGPDDRQRTLEELTPAERKAAVAAFRVAVRARQSQWDAERYIEKLLGREIELGIEDWAASCDDPETLSYASLQEALGNTKEGA